MSITIDRGEVVALVGENGSGKTTLAKILAGLYDPDSGRVLWDETDLADVDPEQLRRAASRSSPRTTRSWPLTARRQHRHGHRQGRGRPAISAAEVAGADQVVAELPHGYRTLLDRRFKDGHELSGGQWQRIAVARGFYRDAPLLICDEPTAALDARAEHALFDPHPAARRRPYRPADHPPAGQRPLRRPHLRPGPRQGHRARHPRPSSIALDGLYADLYNLQASRLLRLIIRYGPHDTPRSAEPALRLIASRSAKPALLLA